MVVNLLLLMRIFVAGIFNSVWIYITRLFIFTPLLLHLFVVVVTTLCAIVILVFLAIIFVLMLSTIAVIVLVV